MTPLGCVLLGAVLWKIDLIYYYIVPVLDQFGIIFIGGLVYLRLPLVM